MQFSEAQRTRGPDSTLKGTSATTGRHLIGDLSTDFDISTRFSDEIIGMGRDDPSADLAASMPLYLDGCSDPMINALSHVPPPRIEHHHVTTVAKHDAVRIVIQCGL